MKDDHSDKMKIIQGTVLAIKGQHSCWGPGDSTVKGQHSYNTYKWGGGGGELARKGDSSVVRAPDS